MSRIKGILQQGPSDCGCACIATIEVDCSMEYWEYVWDYHNRLIEVKQVNAPDESTEVNIKYEYDVFNRRISRHSINNGEITDYAYGRNGALTYVRKEIDNVMYSRTFVYLNDQIIAFIDKDSLGKTECRYTVTDQIGSVTEIYSEDIGLLWKSDYTVFGVSSVKAIDSFDAAFGFEGLFTGKDIDSETGLTYHWNRWRSEDGCSWLSEDPARDGNNWYGYAGQNPLSFVDPSGLFYYTGPSGNSCQSNSSYSGVSGSIDTPNSGGDSNNPKQSESGSPTNSNLSGEGKAPKTTYSPDPDYLECYNPDEPYYQNSKELESLNDLSIVFKNGKWVYDEENRFRLKACNLLSYLFVVQDYTGYNFSLMEIRDIIIFSQETKNPVDRSQMCLLSDYTVKNPDVIMNKAFEMTGHPELTATAGYNIGDLPCRTYTNIEVKTDLGNKHRVVGNFEGSLIYNPWKGGEIKYEIKRTKVYIHGVMKK